MSSVVVEVIGFLVVVLLDIVGRNLSLFLVLAIERWVVVVGLVVVGVVVSTVVVLGLKVTTLSLVVFSVV